MEGKDHTFSIMKYILSFLLAGCMAVVFCFDAAGQSPSGASGTQSQAAVWVAIRAADKGPGQPTAEYCGTVDWKAVSALLAMPNPTGFVELNHAFWMVNGKVVPLSNASVDSVNYGYDNVVYLRIDSIYRVIRLNEAFVKEHGLATGKQVQVEKGQK